MSKIRAGQVAEASPQSGEWTFVDRGFSSKSRTCGLLEHQGVPVRLTFGELQSRLISLASAGVSPLNLVLEAPLSVAFGPLGNPTGRSIELRNGKSRYWYVGLGCSVLVSATYLLRAITESRPTREVRLFEGIVSFKPKEVVSDHCADVNDLRRVIWGEPQIGRVVSPEELATSPNDKLVSAFLVAGMDYGVPPVVAVGG